MCVCELDFCHLFWLFFFEIFPIFLLLSNLWIFFLHIHLNFSILIITMYICCVSNVFFLLFFNVMDAFFSDKHVYTMMIMTKIYISIDRYKSMIIIIMHIYMCVFLFRCMIFLIIWVWWWWCGYYGGKHHLNSF